MNPERQFPAPEKEFIPASETDKDIPEKLRRLHETQGEFLNRGVFFDVYGIELPGNDGRPEPFVFKDFRCGDMIMDAKEQAALFQHQYYEWHNLRQQLGQEFFPESHWIRSPEFSEDEMHGFYAVPGQTANTFREYLKIQLDRNLADRYSSDDKRQGAVKKVMAELGDRLPAKREEKPFIGAIVQRWVNGVPFAEALQRFKPGDAASDRLRENTRRLLARLRDYHHDTERTAFTWHGLGSDNVMAEIDEQGGLTGRVYVVDANFTERPNRAYKEMVVKKMEKGVFAELEKALDLG